MIIQDDFRRMIRRSIVLVLAMLSGVSVVRAELFFNEPFTYQPGASLDGQNGGSGFSGAWSGGNSTIVSGLGGSAGAVQIGSQGSSRSFSTPLSTSGRNIYLSYLMNASSFSGGNYTGISLYDGGNEMPFFGIPWNAQNFGFDGHNGTQIQTVDFNPTVDTTYLIVMGLESHYIPSMDADNNPIDIPVVDLKMWATSDLLVNPDSLVGITPNAQLINELSDFSFDSIQVHGNYASTLKVSGIAAASTAGEAVSATLQSVPEPSTIVLFGLGALGLAIAFRRRNA